MINNREAPAVTTAGASLFVPVSMERQAPLLLVQVLPPTAFGAEAGTLLLPLLHIA
ncbi:hypothetical protein ACFS7Z_17995 [Pontibacter toksunensis]|uniref:Uncharacterized protein n=1 Tax=Pontibacter toksunensis TaxID=1332631 RepID=A0ABW6C0S1_9BACT